MLLCADVSFALALWLLCLANTLRARNTKHAGKERNESAQPRAQSAQVKSAAKAHGKGKERRLINVAEGWQSG